MSAATAPQRPLALVTGGLHRLGAAIAARLAAAGHDIIVHSGHGGDADPALVAATATSGARLITLVEDLEQGGAAERLFAAACAAAGRAPDVLVNNAALFGQGDGWTMAEGDLVRHLAVNMVAPVALTRAVALAAREAGRTAAIVNIIDQRVLNPVPDHIAYTLAKQGLWQATRTLARAFAPHARVNAVAPGLTLPAPDYADGQMERMAARMPLERLAVPADIADAVAFLVTAPAVTGQTLFADGGASLTGWDRDFAFL